MKLRWTNQIWPCIRQNPHLILATLLFFAGITAILSDLSTISGALFGAGASLLGSWVNEWNSRRAQANDKAQNEANARRYLAAELNRAIERVLYVHDRAIPNFDAASRSLKSGTEEIIAIPGDQKEDFRPVMPVLYPSTPHFRDLSGDDAMALIAFYDSLHALDDFVTSWWKRDGQLRINIFNNIRHLSKTSLSLALACVEHFSLESLYPPHTSHGAL